MQQYMTDLVAFDDKLAKRTKGIDLYNYSYLLSNNFDFDSGVTWEIRSSSIKLILEILKEALINDKLRKHT